jgi:uncharacterized protein (DUF169 family)
MDWKKYVEDLNRYVRPNSFPIGINVVKRLSDLPPGARKRRFKMNVCQIGAFARFYGWTIYGEPQDMDCVLGACTCGLIPTPERVTKGVLGDKVYQQDLKAAAAMQKALPKLDPVYKAVVCYPLGAVGDGYDPDVIMVYVDSAQCMRLQQAALWHRGGSLLVPTCGDAGMCGIGIAYVMKTKGVAREVPCLGDRRFGMCRDHEIVFSWHRSRAEEMIEGLQGTHNGGIRYPVPTEMHESQMPPNYFVEVQDLMTKKKPAKAKKK